MLSLSENLTGQDFIEYISTCFHIADIFSLTRNSWFTAEKNIEEQRFLQLLAPYHIRTLHTNHWFCYRVPSNYEIEVYLFHATLEAKEILLSNYDSLFLTFPWKIPEDLCFFKNHKLFAGSVSHENICYVFDETLSLPGVWETTASISTEQIHLPDEP